jgi:tetratricopeptide (TPR) repeat protein
MRSGFVLLAGVLWLAGCATVERVTQDVSGELPAPVATPVKYALAGADTHHRRSLERGLTQLRGENYQGAINTLNGALWDLERVDRRWLRLEELAEAHRALGDAYRGLRKAEWAEEHRTLAMTLAAHARQAAVGAAQGSLLRGKDAYASASFREALAAFRQALVDLENLADPITRRSSLEEARCYLALTHVALDEADRAREEFQRLGALDPSLAFCMRQAPPTVRRLIGTPPRTRGSP